MEQWREVISQMLRDTQTMKLQFYLLWTPNVHYSVHKGPLGRNSKTSIIRIIRSGELGRTRNSHGETRTSYRTFVLKPEGILLGKPDSNAMTILKCGYFKRAQCGGGNKFSWLKKSVQWHAPVNTVT
jgi:hypothetical protein